MRVRRSVTSFVVLALPVLFALPASTGRAQVTRMESITESGFPANQNCYETAISSNGRYVAFETFAILHTGAGPRAGISNLVYLRDLRNLTTTFVAFGVDLDRLGVTNDGDVAFRSEETLVAEDTNSHYDVYVWERSTGEFDLVSRSTGGAVGDAESSWPAITPDGRFVVYRSFASNLVAGDTNGDSDIFRRDRSTGTTIRVSVEAGGFEVDGNSFQPDISDDGRYVAYTSFASTLVPGDGNGTSDVFRYDVDASDVVLVSSDSAGNEGNSGSDWPGIAGDGQTVVFRSGATNLVTGDTNGSDDIFVHYPGTGVTERVNTDSSGNPVGSGTSSWNPDISADGSTVVFTSNATSLVPGDANGGPDHFAKDLATGAIELATVDTFGNQQDGNTGTLEGVHASGDGGLLVFDASAKNLHRSDFADFRARIFTRDRRTDVQITSITPNRGSNYGDREIVIAGSGFTSVDDTNVWFDRTNLDRYGTIVAVEPTRITLRTPVASLGLPEHDLVVRCGAGGDGIQNGYTVISNAIDCRFGNTNIGAGSLENVLTIDGSIGVGDERVVTVPLSTPFSMFIDTPSSRASARYVLYVAVGEPDSSTALPVGFDLGLFCFTPYFEGGMPAAIFNNIGKESVLGSPDYGSMPAPSQVFSYGGFNNPRVFTFQAIIQDDQARNSRKAAVTNAITLRVE